MRTIKTLVFKYTKLQKDRYLLTLEDKEHPSLFVNHPLQFKIMKNPNAHFKRNLNVLKGGVYIK